MIGEKVEGRRKRRAERMNHLNVGKGAQIIDPI